MPYNSYAPSSLLPSFMGDPFPFVLAGSNCQPFVKSEHRPSGGSRPFAW